MTKPTVNIALATIALSLLFHSNPAVYATEPSTQGIAYFKQAKYAAAAQAFAKAYASTHSATDCYYTALSYHYDGKADLARKFYQETLTRYPSSREAAMAQQALAAVRPMSAARISGQNNQSSPTTQPTQQAPVTQASPGNSVDDLLSKAAGAEQANQPSTADAYYSDAIREAEKQGHNNPKLVDVLGQAANYYVRNHKLDKALLAFDRQRNMLQMRYGKDSVQCGNNILSIARMYKGADDVEDAKTHYYEAIDTYSNALSDAEAKSTRSAVQPRALLADTLDELANYLYNLVYSTRGYGNIEISSQHTSEIEISKLRRRAEQVRLGN